MPNTYRTLAVLLGLGVIYTTALVVLSLLLDTPTHKWLFSEAGPFEAISEWLWFLAAAMCLWILRDLPGRGIAPGLAAVLLGLREADWHKAFTTDSMFKINYYEMPEITLWEKIPAGALALSIIMLVIYLATRAWGLIVQQGCWREPWGLMVIIGALILPVIKVVDRAPAVLDEDFGVVLSPLTTQIVRGIEEGGEMAIPLIFMAALLMYKAAQRDKQAPPL